MTIFGKIRIIGGKWKGRKIVVPSVPNRKMVRPTMNCVREMLFNWLGSFIFQSVCLDCFFGTGALGLEALSRGAKKVTFIDKNYYCVLSLTKVFYSFQKDNFYDNHEIIHADCLVWLKKNRNQYDVVFLDPPFQDKVIYELIYLLETYRYLKKKSLIYIEISRKELLDVSLIPKYWFLYKLKITRTVTCYLYIRDL